TVDRRCLLDDRLERRLVPGRQAVVRADVDGRRRLLTVADPERRAQAGPREHLVPAHRECGGGEQPRAGQRQPTVALAPVLAQPTSAEGHQLSSPGLPAVAMPAILRRVGLGLRCRLGVLRFVHEGILPVAAKRALGAFYLDAEPRSQLQRPLAAEVLRYECVVLFT